MNQRLFDILLGGLAGFVLAAGLSTVCADRQMRDLQDYSHQVALNAAAIAFRARQQADSLRHRADSLLAARRPILLRATIATAYADTAHAIANQARADSNLRAENVALRVENIALRRAQLSLWAALAQSDQIIAAERQRGDSLNKALGDMHLQLQGLTARVADLKPAPKLLRIAWQVVELAGVGYAGYEIGRHERSSVAPQTARVRQCHTFANGVVRCL